MSTLTENIRKLLSIDEHVYLTIGEQKVDNHKLWVSLEPGWVVHEESFAGECGRGNTLEEAVEDYMKIISGKSFLVEEEEMEPYEVKIPF